MPAFHTHWLVALKAISNAPDYVKAGYAAYQEYTLVYRDACIAALRGNNLERDCNSARTDWENDLKKNLDEVTCFSAYMLGACGPDFWMLPSEPKVMKVKPSMADIHFDLGHYNRAHRQFELSIAEVGGKDRTDMHTRVQRSYFMGMATHIAADLIVHQLVNVVAGAYNLLEKASRVWFDKVWENEGGGALGLNIWNTHNKVEQFWDSYVRYRYLGDLGPLWPQTGQQPNALGKVPPSDDQPWVDPLGFPTIEGLDACNPFDNGADFLRKESTRFAIEKPLMFPWLFCDRVLAGQIEPFIYRLVVDKDTGSYRANELGDALAKKAVKEAGDDQMKNAADVPGEWQKLFFFSSGRNLGIDSTSFNFLTFKVCPNVEQTRRFAGNVFYDYEALGPFIRKAVAGAQIFLGELSTAYDERQVGSLKKLRRFWNLDTGLGLRVFQRAADTNRESITDLKFVHVFEELGGGTTGYKRRLPYLSGRASKDYPFAKAQAFETYPAAAPFKDIDSVYEERNDAYLERIALESPSNTVANAEMVATSTINDENVLVSRELRHRVTLCFRASIADLRSPAATQKDDRCENLALFLLGDKAGQPGEAASGETRKWLAKESRVLDYRTTPRDMKRGLQRFATWILANGEKEDAGKARAATREIAKGAWNNVVPYSKHEGHYGRNFAIGTGRKFVLYSSGGGAFDPVNKLGYYTNISPTEHVFFTLYPLVREGGDYWDIFSKEDVPGGQLAELRKISSCGTVKIVLIYQRDGDLGLRLCEAYIDGLKAPVET
jgi:hypothetical protein